MTFDCQWKEWRVEGKETAFVVPTLFRNISDVFNVQVTWHIINMLHIIVHGQIFCIYYLTTRHHTSYPSGGPKRSNGFTMWNGRHYPNIIHIPVATLNTIFRQQSTDLNTVLIAVKDKSTKRNNVETYVKYIFQISDLHGKRRFVKKNNNRNMCWRLWHNRSINDLYGLYIACDIKLKTSSVLWESML